MAAPKFHRTLDSPRQKKFSRIAIIGSITMLQGALYLVLSIWALLIFACQFDMTSTNIGTIMYFFYFRNRDCAEVRWSRSNADVADLPRVTFVAERTEGLVISYIAISFLWILTSLFVIVGATRSKLNRTAFHCYFTPWAIVMIAGCLLDVIATAFFIYDICHTSSAENTFQYLGVKNIWEIIHPAEANYKNFDYPSIIFVCVSSRLVFLFFFNFFAMIWAVKQATKLILSDEQMSSNGRRTVTPVPPTDEPGRSVPIDSTQYYYVPTRSPVDSIRQLADPYRRTFEPLKSNNDLNSQIIPPDYSGIASSERKRPTPVQQLQYNPSNMSGGEADLVVQRRRKSTTKSPAVENRYSGSIPAVARHQQANDIIRVQSDRQGTVIQIRPPDRLSAPPQQDRSSIVTGELRSQLPWSYFNAREDMAAPRKALAHADEHEILPPVPVPDYTLHFPRKDRYTIQDRVAQLQASSGYSSTSASNQNGVSRW